jgi:GntR family transcriptional repressor for pyruvate dehydrogenase complex
VPTSATPPSREPFFANHPFAQGLTDDSALNAVVELLQSLKPGERLPSERELTEQLNLSRNTLRDRIGRLESLGALSREERRGTFYTGVQPEHASDLIVLSLVLQQMTLDSLVSVRHALERQAAIEACAHADEDDLRTLRARIDEMGATTDGKKLLAADIAFHGALFAASASPALLFFQRMLHTVIKGTLRTLTLEQDFRTMQCVHADILTSVEQRDVEAATRAIDAHFAWLHVLYDQERGESEAG